MASKPSRSSDSAVRSWLMTWCRHVLPQPLLRISAVWTGLAIIVAATMGGNGLSPPTLVRALHFVPSLAVGLATIWLLLLFPSAKAIIATRNAWLDALPHSHGGKRVIQLVCLFGAQLPLFVVWTLAGEFTEGMLIASVATSVLWGAAIVKLPAMPCRTPTWKTPITAYVGTILRGCLRQLRLDGLRTVGFAILAGLASGEMIRRNELDRTGANTLGVVIAISCLLPAIAPLFAVIVVVKRKLRIIETSSPLARVTRVTAWLIVALVALSVPTAMAAGSSVAVADMPTSSSISYCFHLALSAAAISPLCFRVASWADRKRIDSLAILLVGLTAVIFCFGLAVGFLGVTAIYATAFVGAAIAVALPKTVVAA